MNRKNVNSTTSVIAVSIWKWDVCFPYRLADWQETKDEGDLIPWGCFQENEAELVTDLKTVAAHSLGGVTKISKTKVFFAENK